MRVYAASRCMPLGVYGGPVNLGDRLGAAKQLLRSSQGSDVVAEFERAVGEPRQGRVAQLVKRADAALVVLDHEVCRAERGGRGGRREV